ncbi:Alpha/Beta hydrolase protein [Hypoxylon crocopeplum]|nr:Alpha/Beta hydrolase protein [Hypoxylon crocopeplum]
MYWNILYTVTFLFCALWAETSPLVTPSPSYPATQDQCLSSLIPTATRQPNADVLSIRSSVAATGARQSDTPDPNGILGSNYSATSIDGTAFDVYRFIPQSVQQAENSTTAHRAIIFVFGGGMISGSVQYNLNTIALIANGSGTQVFAPEYRVAPEHPFPAAVEDVYSTVVWLQSNAARFNIDPARIVIFGGSAGGGISTGVTLMARDRGLDPPLAALVARYPMLDDMTMMEDNDPIQRNLTWTVGSNNLGWKLYLGGKERGDRSDDNVSQYAAPARARDLNGLPPAHIGVGTLDLFMKEDSRYAANLARSNVRVEFHLYPDVPHGFDAVPTLEQGRQMRENEARFIMSL